MKSKFKVGDKIRLVIDKSYYANGKELDVGDITTIMEIGTYGDEISYRLEGDNYNTPNWLQVEKHFELVKITLKDMLND